MKRFLSTATLGIAACSGTTAAPDAAGANCTFRSPRDDVPAAVHRTPRWAFRPWISKDISDAADTRAFVAGFAARDIPVGAVVLDSPWETHYNTFVPSPTRYPDFDGLIAELHAADIRIVLWLTQMVNATGFDLEPGGDTYVGPAPNYQQGADCGFYVDQGAQYLWWKGQGAGVDFFNREAVAWWHRQQDDLLARGIDGWKLDFGEQYLMDPPFDTAAGEVSLQDYSEAYYADFIAYGRHHAGPEFVTMVRPWDESYGFPGRFYARPEDAPVGWVGDNRRDWLGLTDALDHLFRSAAAGYITIGSDVGGYLDRSDTDFNEIVPFDTLVFARWTAVGALSPFMQLHGRANITPWTVPDHVEETIALYRYWATLHDQLVPFFFSLSEAAYDGGEPIMRPIGDTTAWPGDYRWMLGDALLVAPILDDSGVRNVALPAGTWHSWWDPAAAPIAGPTLLTNVAVTDRAQIPLFVRSGAIIPAEVTNAVTELGSAASADALTLAIWPDTATSTFRVRDETPAVEVSARRTEGATNIAISGASRSVILRIHSESAPSAVARDRATITELSNRDAALTATSDAWAHDAAAHVTWVRLAPHGTTATVTLTL